MIDITAIITLHNEGVLATPSLKSAIAARKVAEDAGISVSILAMLDRPNEETVDVASDYAGSGIEIESVDVGDAGESRNAGIQKCQSRYVAFLDGDDLWGDEWLIKAHRMAIAVSKPTVYHPELNLYFAPREAHFFQHVSDTDYDYSPHVLAMENYWTALNFTERDILLAHPIESARVAEGFGHEDWHWNMTVAALGIAHTVVPDTIHFIRRRTQSRGQEAVARRTMTKPSPEFKRLLFPHSQLRAAS